MAHLISSENNFNTWERMLPEPETTDIARGKRAVKSEHVDQQELPIHKRLKSSSSQATKQWSFDSNESPFAFPHSVYNLLKEPCPLGLRLKKSRSLLELIQARVNQAFVETSNKDVMAIVGIQGPNVKARVGVTGPKVNARVGVSGPKVNASVGVSGPDVSPRAGISGPVDKLKASNFPAMLLKIGKWEYASKYEGDLVAKCYFAKHKLVWEVLHDKLKNKIEIQWGDIMGLKANFSDNGPATLTVLLGKQPLFFRETDPQPRKHTVWQPTSDFTGGEASTYRLHYLQCSQGVLNKHYEKLIQCDTRLNCLSQQVDPLLDLPPAPKDQYVSNNNGSTSNQPERSNGPVVPYIKNTGPVDLVRGDFMKPYGYVPIVGLGQINAPAPQQSMSISDIVAHTRAPACDLPVYNNTSSGVDQSQLINNVSKIPLNDTQLTTASDEKSPTSGVNSLSSLQDGNESNDNSDPEAANYHVQEWGDGNDLIIPFGNPTPENENENGMLKVDSFSDLLDQLPQIASLPELFFDASGELEF